MNRTQSELCAAGALSQVLGEEGVSIADTLSRLSDEEYRIVIAAIELYREEYRRVNTTQSFCRPDIDEGLLTEVLGEQKELEALVRRILLGQPLTGLIKPSPRDPKTGATILQDTRPFGQAGRIVQEYVQKLHQRRRSRQQNRILPF